MKLPTPTFSSSGSGAANGTINKIQSEFGRHVDKTSPDTEGTPTHKSNGQDSGMQELIDKIMAMLSQQSQAQNPPQRQASPSMSPNPPAEDEPSKPSGKGHHHHGGLKAAVEKALASILGGDSPGQGISASTAPGPTGPAAPSAPGL